MTIIDFIEYIVCEDCLLAIAPGIQRTQDPDLGTPRIQRTQDPDLGTPRPWHAYHAVCAGQMSGTDERDR